MYTFFKSDEFNAWLSALQDPVGRARIAYRIRSAEAGHFGDCNSVGEGVFEMRIHVGPGYRLYYMRSAKTVYWLLLGGDKSTQQHDIDKAHSMAKAIKETLK